MERRAGEQAALIAAFRQGLGLCGVAVIRGAAGIRFDTAGPTGIGSLATGETGEVHFWCRHAADGDSIAAAANAKLRRQSSVIEPCARRDASNLTRSVTTRPDQALIATAARLHVALYADEQITRAAIAAIARLEEELETMRRSGALKSVNRSYRAYRRDSSARGEKIVPYAAWFRKYKENLVRQLAAALRYF